MQLIFNFGIRFLALLASIGMALLLSITILFLISEAADQKPAVKKVKTKQEKVENYKKTNILLQDNEHNNIKEAEECHKHLQKNGVKNFKKCYDILDEKKNDKVVLSVIKKKKNIIEDRNTSNNKTSFHEKGKEKLRKWLSSYFGKSKGIRIYEMVASYSFVTLLVLGIVVAQIIAWNYFLLALIGIRSKLLHNLRTWSVESPPVLGIVGTLYAMVAFFAANAGATNVWDLFFDKFILAAATTILGGITNVSNLALLSIVGERKSSHNTTTEDTP